MPKVSYSAGMTMHVGQPGNNEYIKLTLSVDDVDTEIPFEDQIEKIHVTSHQLMQWMEENLAEKMMEQIKQ